MFLPTRDFLIEKISSQMVLLGLLYVSHVGIPKGRKFDFSLQISKRQGCEELIHPSARGQITKVIHNRVTHRHYLKWRERKKDKKHKTENSILLISMDVPLETLFAFGLVNLNPTN